MDLTKTSNPVLKVKTFDISAEGKTMTVSGAVNKSIILFLVLLASGIFSWKFAAGNPESAAGMVLPAVLIAFVLALVTIFAKKAAPITTPFYAIAEGFALGIISLAYASFYKGIVLQAVILTLGILGVMLLAYKFGMIKATAKFKSGVIMATGGIALVYILTWVLGFFGITIPYIHEGGIIGIGISLFIVVIAALNLILDFSFFEEATAAGSPKYMEWYAAFGLMLTLVWLYLEILRLLSKLKN